MVERTYSLIYAQLQQHQHTVTDAEKEVVVYEGDFSVNIVVVDVEVSYDMWTNKLTEKISEPIQIRAYEINGERFSTSSELEAERVCVKVNKALDTSMDALLMGFDPKTAFRKSMKSISPMMQYAY